MLKLRYILISLLLIVISCKRQVSTEMYLKYNQRDALGRYAFNINMSDSTCNYDVGIYLSMKYIDGEYVFFKGLPLIINWLSPDNKLYQEKVYLSKKDGITSDYYTKQFRANYREKLVPEKYGNWIMYVSVPQSDSLFSRVLGVGIRLTRRKNGA